MGKATVTYESAANLPSGPVSFTYAIDDVYDHDLSATLLASEKYRYVVATSIVSVQEGVNADGTPIMVDRSVTTRNPATFAQALEIFSRDAIGDRIVNAVNQYRIVKAQAIALEGVNVIPITATIV